MNIKDAYIHNGEAILKDIQISGSKLQKLKAGKNADDTYLTWVDVLDLSPFGASGHNHDDRYVKKSGDTMTGLLTTTSGGNHKGIKVGGTYINAIGSDLIFQNNGTIRFGGDSWDYNVWAGLKYVHSSKTIYLGLADGSAFTANSAQSGGKLYTPGISDIYIGNGTYTVYHTNNLSIKTLMGTTAIGDADEPVYWNGSSFVKAGAYPTKASWNYDDRYLKLSGGTLSGGITFKYGSNHTDQFIQFSSTDSNDPQTVYLGIRRPISSYGPCYKDNKGNLYDLIHGGNYTTYTVKKDGTGATGTWDINISGGLTIPQISSEADIKNNYLKAYSGSGSSWTGEISSMTYAAILGIGSPSRGFQLWAQRGDGAEASLHYRVGTFDQTAWNTERILIDNETYNLYSPKLDGTGATGTWKINISGNATTATKANSIATERGTNNAYRNVFFAYAGDNTKVVYDDDFTYNPSTNTLKIGTGTLTATNYSGTATNANNLANIAAGNYFKHRDAVFNSEWSGKYLWTLWDNHLYAADKRLAVTLTGTTSTNFSSLFDGSFESSVSITETKAVLHIKSTTEGNVWTEGLPYGDFYVVFYNSDAENITGRVYCNYAPQGTGWHDLAITHVGSCIWKLYNVYYQLSDLEITITKPVSSASIDLCQVLHVVERSPSPYYAAVMSKYCDQKTNYNIEAAKFIKTGGTSSQFLKADGSVDSNTYSKSDHKHSFSDITPGVATIGDGANRLMFRTNSSYKNGIYYSTPGNEALVFGTIDPMTSWIFATVDPTLNTAWTSLTPSLQIKHGRVTINKLIANTTDASYNLDVNGSANATTLYENGVRVSVNGHTHSYIVTQGDNRSVATKPNDYSNRITFAGLKNNSTIGSPSSTTYNYVVGLRGWSDISGGKAHELAFNDNGIFHRIGATDTWETWAMMLTTSNYNSYVPSLTGTGASGTWDISITGNAKTATNAGYATSAGNAETVDNYHAMSAGSLFYKYVVTATIPASSVTGDFWYATITFKRNYVAELTRSILSASYSNIAGQVYLNTYTYNGSWYAFTSYFNGSNIKGISFKQQNNPIYYVKLAKPTIFNNVVENGKITVYSPYNCTITVSATAPSGVTFTNINCPGFTNLKANSAYSADSATTSTYASNVGSSGTAGTNYVTASNVISMYNWYNSITATDEASNTAIDKWNEIVSFLAGIADTSTLSGILAGYAAVGHNHDKTYLKLSGGNVTGQTTIRKDLTGNLSDWVSKQHLGPFEVGRATNSMCVAIGVTDDNYGYIQVKGYGISTPGNLVLLPGSGNLTVGNATNTVYHKGNLSIATLMGSTAIGDSDEPVYWNGSKFVKAGAYPTKSSWNYDDRYLKLSGGTLTGVLHLLGSKYEDSANTGAIDLANSDIYGVNSIKFADLAESAGEGLQWYRDATHVDSLWVNSGVIYFSPNRTWGGTVTNYTVWHSGNDGSGSGLDADLLDGKHASDFSLSTHTHDYIAKLRRLNEVFGYSSFASGMFPPALFELKTAGYPVYSDPEFASGYNEVYVYNNYGNGTVTITREQAGDHTNSSGFQLKITTAGEATPGCGGFYQPISSRANAIFVQIFRAKIPVGYNVNNASNPMGTNYQDRFITDRAGTGKWEWYARVVYCDSSGSFSVGGHVYLSANSGYSTTSVTWYLSYCNVIDITKGAYDGLRTRYADSADSVIWNNVTEKPTTINGYGITDALKIDGSNGTAEGVSALINKLSVGSSDPTDADYYVCQYAGGGATTTTYHRRPMSAMWNWIKAKTDTRYPTKTGSGASGTWGINVTGSAGSVAWGNVTGKPSSYTPTEHNHEKITHILWGYSTAISDTTSPADICARFNVAVSGVHAIFTGIMQNSNGTRYQSLFWTGYGAAGLVELTKSYGGDGRLKYRVSSGWSDNGAHWSTTGYRQLANVEDLTWINIESKPETATRWPSWSEVTDKPTFTTWSEISAAASYSLSNAAWTNTITLPTTAGSYILNIVSGNSTLTGVFSIGASDNAKDEISLHLHGNGPRLYARTNGTTLQLSSNDASATSRSVTIKYRRMI